MGTEHLIKEFLRFLQLQGIQEERRKKYKYQVGKALQLLNKDPHKATKKDLEDLINNIDNNKKYTEWTKHDYKVIIKKFFTWIHNKEIEDLDEWETPKIVKWIKIKAPRTAKKLPSELITPKDIKLLEGHCRTLREKALLLTLYESGARIGELRNLKLKDVSFDKFGCILNLFGKTGFRQVRLVGSAPAISNWIQEEHPKKNDKNSYLFCNTYTNKSGEKITYQSVAKILKKLKTRSNFKKDINPHQFRHSRATELAEHLTDAQRCNFFGWIQGSQVCRIYTHLQDTDRAVLELNGLVEKDKDQNGQFKNVVCPRCKTSNPYGSKICNSCSMGLDLKSIEEYEKKDRWIHKFLDPETLDKMMGEKFLQMMKEYNK